MVISGSCLLHCISFVEPKALILHSEPAVMWLSQDWAQSWEL